MSQQQSSSSQSTPTPQSPGSRSTVQQARSTGGDATPTGSRPARQPHPDRSKLRAGFVGILKSIWFLVALVLYALGWMLHQLARGLMTASGLGAVPRSAPLRPSPPFEPVPRD